MMKQGLLTELRYVQEFFERSISCLTEDDSGFVPTEGMMPVCQQVAHAAQSIDWFIEGMTRPEGFDMDFETHFKEVSKSTSLEDAKKWFANSIQAALKTVEEMSEEALMQPLPEGPVMGGQPKLAVIGAISEHTAHHRGALTVYSRLIGKTPTMPYMD